MTAARPRRAASSTSVVFLRAVNVGGKNRVPMADLRELLAARGASGVATHIQSGNIVLTAPGGPEGAALLVAQVVLDAFGVDVPAVGRSAGEIAAVAARHPFAAAAGDERALHVAFLSGAADPQVAASLDEVTGGADRVAASGRELYLWYSAGVGNSKLTNALLERRLGVVATTRNWATVTRMAEMAAGAG